MIWSISLAFYYRRWLFRIWWLSVISFIVISKFRRARSQQVLCLLKIAGSITWVLYIYHLISLLCISLCCFDCNYYLTNAKYYRSNLFIDGIECGWILLGCRDGSWCNHPSHRLFAFPTRRIRPSTSGRKVRSLYNCTLLTNVCMPLYAFHKQQGYENRYL